MPQQTTKLSAVGEMLKKLSTAYEDLSSKSGEVVKSTANVIDHIAGSTSIWSKATAAHKEFVKATEKHTAFKPDEYATQVAQQQGIIDGLTQQLDNLHTRAQKARQGGNRQEVEELAAQAAGTRRELDGTKASLEALMSQEKGIELRRKVIATSISALKATVGLGLVKESLSASYKFNELLYEGNSDLKVRDQLFGQALDTQLATGVSMEKIVDVQKALRERGQLYLDSADAGLKKVANSGNVVGGTLEDTVMEATKLSQTFNLSAGQISDVVQVTQQMKVSFRDVGDTLTNIVERTGETFDEAKKQLQSIANTARGYGFNLVEPKLQKMQEAVAALESAMVQVGGDHGVGQKVFENLTNLSTKAGAMALMFGGGPEAARDPIRFQQAQAAEARYLKQFSGNSLMAQMAFNQVAESMGLTATDARALIDAQDHLGERTSDLATHTKTLDDRFADQAAEAGQSWKMLGTELLAVSNLALKPLIPPIRWLGETAMEAGNLIKNHPFFKDLLKGAVDLGVVVTTLGLAIKAAKWFSLGLVDLVKAGFATVKATYEHAVDIAKLAKSGNLGKDLATDISTWLKKLLPGKNTLESAGSKTAKGAESLVGKALEGGAQAGGSKLAQKGVSLAKSAGKIAASETAATAEGVEGAAAANATIGSLVEGAGAPVVTALTGVEAGATSAGAALVALLAPVAAAVGAIALIAYPLYKMSHAAEDAAKKLKELSDASEKHHQDITNIISAEVQSGQAALFDQSKPVLQQLNNFKDNALSSWQEAVQKAVKKESGYTADSVDQLIGGDIESLKNRISAQEGMLTRESAVLAPTSPKLVQDQKDLSVMISLLSELIKLAKSDQSQSRRNAETIAAQQNAQSKKESDERARRDILQREYFESNAWAM